MPSCVMRATLPTPEAKLAALAAAVQHNCDVIDARHARDSGLCTYLLGMREYFRWVSGLDLGAKAEPGAVGSWIAHREQEWEALLERGADRLVALPLAGGREPYDEEAVNQQLAPDRLVYGAGVGRFGVPLFFLARCEYQGLRDGVKVVIAGDELARGFVATPAVSRGASIVVRLDALRRWLWTRAETAATREPDDAFRCALDAYGRGGPMDETIERMARSELESLILHELGEMQAGQIVGPDWERMLAQLNDRRAELVVRAVRDLLADCLVTLPVLLERRATASLDFWFSNFDGVRRALAPQMLDIRDGTALALDGDRMHDAIARGQARWGALAVDLLARWRHGGPTAVAVLTDALHPK